MNIEKLLNHFPGAADAYKSGEAWEWTPQFEDGYPCPSIEDGAWVMRTRYPGFRMQDRNVEVVIFEMLVEELDCSQIFAAAESAVHVATVHTEVGSMPMWDTDNNETQIKKLFIDVSHECWVQSKAYFEHARLTGTDPLVFLHADQDDPEDVRRAALEELITHLESDHADIEAVRVSGDECLN